MAYCEGQPASISTRPSSEDEEEQIQGEDEREHKDKGEGDEAEEMRGGGMRRRDLMVAQFAGPALFRRPGYSDPHSPVPPRMGRAEKNEPKYRGLRNKQENGHRHLEDSRE